MMRDLERQYDGPIPKPLLDAAREGGAHKLRVKQAKANLRFWRSQVRLHIGAIRNATTDGHREVQRDHLQFAWDWYRRAQRELAHARARAAAVEHANHLFSDINQIAAE